MGSVAFFSLLIAAAGIAGAHFQVTSAPLGASILLVGACLAVMNLLTALIQLASRQRRGGRGGAWLSVFVGLPMAAVLGFSFFIYQQHFVGDISTDTKEAPRFLFPLTVFSVREGQKFIGGAPVVNREYSTEFAAEQKGKTYFDLSPPTSLLPLDRVFAGTRAGMRERFPDLREVMADEATRHLEYETQWGFFRFPVDIAIEIRTENSMSTVEVRARSRYPRFDFGKSHDYAAKIIVDLNAALSALPPEAPKAALVPPPAPSPPPAPPQKNSPTGRK